MIIYTYLSVYTYMFLCIYTAYNWFQACLGDACAVCIRSGSQKIQRSTPLFG